MRQKYRKVQKAGSRRESNPRHLWLELPNALPLSYGNQTTTNTHNPLYVLQRLAGLFTFLYFRLITSKLLYFQHKAMKRLVLQTGIRIIQIFVLALTNQHAT